MDIYRSDISERNLCIIHSVIMGMTRDIPYNKYPVWHINRVKYHARIVNSQFDRIIFLRRSHVR